jgi:hypothetical protein
MNRKLVRLSVFVALAAASGPSILAAQDADTWIDTDGYEGGGGLRARSRIVPPTHTVQRGDTLWDISGRYYGNPWDWPRLWSYNPEVTNPHWIYPRDQLRLMPGGQAQLASQAEISTTARRGVQPGTLFLRELGYLDAEALEQSGEIIGSPTDHMLLSPFDSVYVRFSGDRTERERPSGEFTIYRAYEAAERERGEQGTLVRILGTVRIDRYDEDRRIAQATITEALEPIERGYRVAAIPRRFQVVPPVSSDRDIETEVVATLLPHQLLGEQQVVFVPVGEDDGVRLGNRFYVTRRSDEWRRHLESSPQSMGQDVAVPEDPDEWPEEVIAEGRVVSLRPRSAGLWITSSITTVEVGDHVEMREGY